MPNFYGVWVGRSPGVYDNWNACKAQTDKFPAAKFRKLKSTDYKQALAEFNAENISPVTISQTNTSSKSKPVLDCGSLPENDILTVDGASNGHNCEFRAVWFPSNKEVFASKVYDGGTNNIAEFLGLVFALKHLMEKKLPLKVYSDSVTAMAWFRNMKANTTAHQTGKATQELTNLIEGAEKFLQNNRDVLSNAQVLKWDTKNWGEIAADYGRK